MALSSHHNIAAGLLVAALSLGAAAVPVAASPVHVIITQPLDAPTPAGYLKQLGAWSAAGDAYAVTFLQGQPDSAKPAFASLAILDFPSESAYASWARKAGTLDKRLVVRRADVMAHSETGSRDPHKAVFIINHYESLVSPEAIQDYTDHYTIPKLSGQVTAGILKHYTAYLEREPAGSHSKIVLVMEYADQAALDRKAAVKAPHKKMLQQTLPQWKRLSETKSAIRTDLNETKALATPVS